MVVSKLARKVHFDPHTFQMISFWFLVFKIFYFSLKFYFSVSSLREKRWSPYLVIEKESLEKKRERFKERDQSDKEKENRWLFQK
jgi:hypothetical protein